MRSAPESTLEEPDQRLYVPEMARIVSAEDLTEFERLFEIRLPEGRDLEHVPGQFVQVSMFGFGEAPISLCSSPVKTGSFELCVRRAGGLTAALHGLGAGDMVGIRGPFGNGFPIDRMQGKDVVIVAGGIGMAPVRSLIQHILADRDSYGRMIVLHGAREPDLLLFTDEIESWGSDDRNEILLTVDKPVEGWDGHVGVITTLFPRLKIDSPSSLVVAMCGPPVMYRFVLLELRSLRIPEDQSFLSLERNMRCGVGKCGHCQVDHRYVCVDGPVFSAAELAHLHEGI